MTYLFTNYFDSYDQNKQKKPALVLLLFNIFFKETL